MNRVFMVTWLSHGGYLNELVEERDLKVVVAGGSYSQLLRRDCDVVMIRRVTTSPDGNYDWWVEVHADRIVELVGYEMVEAREFSFKK